ncbi:MAG: hypothetical protein RLZZ76_356 [Candidatus Parcubacteria bacterium]|jgi:8-oxo-dGTP pyrophosphatase MutT (NUDIX family)
MNNPIKTAGVVAFTEDRKRVLLIKHNESAGHKTGAFGIPAGKVKEGENDVTTAVRELEEESGVTVYDTNELIPLPHTYNATIQTKEGMKTFSLKAFTYSLSEETQLRGSEEGEVHLVDITEVSSLLLLPNVERMIADALTQLQT